ncbi:uncharacterized protein LOC132558820 [Ylistrum balloti]|uniref:uncharacterized protein LOC132558820 n=1 Tax=Ylistrum balloti TaxID=509963 RepID=UPI002905A470|nr:uncharacterized protein LOC132558820 [Ylistrum balloti]
MAPGGAVFVFLSFCIGTMAADCSYLYKHYVNETDTYREVIRLKTCSRTQECCGNYTDRRCCPLSSRQTSSYGKSNQHAPALLLIGITSALVIIGVIAIFCWRLVCLSAYKESRLSVRSQPAGTQDRNEANSRQDRRHVTRLGHHHGMHGHGHHHRVHVALPSPHYSSPVVLLDEHFAGPHPPAYTKKFPELKYLAPPSYEDTVAVRETDPPPAYTDERTSTCSDHVSIDMHQEEDTERSRDQAS